MMNINNIRTYSEMVSLKTFEDRYNYLKLEGEVGKDTFGYDRYLNQIFYQRNPEWKKIRDKIILRDNGCDLGIDGREIFGKIIVHHMNPITKNDLLKGSEFLYNPDFLICVSNNTHNAIHYGDEESLIKIPVERTPYDTCPWRK